MVMSLKIVDSIFLPRADKELKKIVMANTN